MNIIIDILASSYGWAKSAILDEVYLDEAWDYICMIKRRRLSDYKVLVSIYHSEPKDVLGLIEQEEKSIDPEDYIELEQLDKTAFENLKVAMRNNPRIVVKG